MRHALAVIGLMALGGAAYLWWLRPTDRRAPPVVPTPPSTHEPAIELTHLRIVGSLDGGYTWTLAAEHAAARPASQTVVFERVTRAELRRNDTPVLRVETTSLMTNRLTHDVQTEAPVTVRTDDGAFAVTGRGLWWDARARQLRIGGPVQITLGETVVTADDLVWEVEGGWLRAGGRVALAGPWGHAEAEACELRLADERFALSGSVRGTLVWPRDRQRVAQSPALPAALRDLLLRAGGHRP